MPDQRKSSDQVRFRYGFLGGEAGDVGAVCGCDRLAAHTLCPRRGEMEGKTCLCYLLFNFL
jgi:hypothetical protein